MPTGPYPTDPPPTFLAVPKDYYDMTPEQQDAVLGQMADLMIREQIEPWKKAQTARRRVRAAARSKR